MGWREWFQPSPRMVAARWIAESMRREPQEWARSPMRMGGYAFKRGAVEVEIDGWLKINGEMWFGKEKEVIVKAVETRNALVLTLQLAEAHQ